MAFDREKFLRANQNIGTGNFQNFKEGMYIVKLLDASIAPAKTSGKEQVTFVWQVDDPSDDLNEKKIYDRIGLETDEQNEIFAIRLNQLGVTDRDAFSMNMDGNLQYLCGRTRVRLRVKHVPNPKGGDFQNIRIEKLIQGAYSGENNQIQNKTETPPITTGTNVLPVYFI